MPVPVGPVDGFDGNAPGFSTSAGAPIYPAVSYVRQGESASMEIITTGSDVYVRRSFPTAPRCAWMGFYLSVSPLAATSTIAVFDTVTGSQPGRLKVDSTGIFLENGIGSGTQLAITPGTWYWVELILDVSVNPHVLTARVNGVSLDGVTRAAAADTVSYAQLGSLSGDTSGKSSFYAHWMRGYAAHSQDWLGDPAARRSGWVTRFMDSFERPNSSGPDMGIPAWGTSLPMTGSGSQNFSGFGVTSKAAVTSGGATDRMMLCRTRLGPDQFAEAEITVSGTAGGGAGAGLALRANGDGTMYRCVVDHAASNNIEITKSIDATFTALTHFTTAWTDGDLMRFEADGPILSVYRNGTLIGSVVDFSIQNGGFAGIAQSSTVTSCSIDDFVCGEWLGSYEDEVLRDDPRAFYPMRNLPTDQPAEPQFVGAGAGASVASGNLSLTKTGCTKGNLIIVHGSNIVNGGRVQFNSSADNNIGDLAGRFTPSGQEMSLVGSGGEVIGANGGEQLIAIGRALVDGTISVSLRSVSGTDPLIGRIYEFSGVSKSSAWWEVYENLEDGTRYNLTQNSGTSTTIQPGAVSTRGQCRLALAFTALAANAALDEFTGETGGDWVEPIAEYSSSSPASSIGLQIALMRADGRLSGGSDTISSAPWAVVTFALIPDNVVDVGIEFPSAPVLDAFTGADETPIATNWTAPLKTGENSARRLSNTFAPAVAGSVSSAYWDLQSFLADCEFYATLSTAPGAGDYVDIWARGSGFGGASQNGYYLRVTNTTIQLYQSTGGTDSQLSQITRTISSGDKIGIRCIGSYIESWHMPTALGVWVLVDRKLDTTWSSGGRTGIKTNGTVPRVDDFGGGGVAYILDYSGNGNHIFFATGSSFPQYGQPGLRRYEAPPNYSVLFDSADAPPHQVLQSPDADSLDYADIFSLEAWIKRDNTSDAGEMYIVGRGADGSGASGGIFLHNHYLKLGQSNVDYIMDSTIQITDQNVHHVVGTKNGKRRRVYIDGVEVTNYASTLDNATCTNPAQGVTIGAEVLTGAPSSTFDGTLDDVAVYASELSPERIKAHYDAGLRKRGLSRVA